jgi:hypothetical protein
MTQRLSIAELPAYAEMAATYSYDPETGMITRISSPHARAIGRVVGHSDGRGYLQIRHQGKELIAHRVAWLLAYGEWPDPERDLDHINRDRTDNRIENLRLATRSENIVNGPVRNRLGVRGVRHRPDMPQGKQYEARITKNKKITVLGFFGTADDASIAYQNASKQFYPGFSEA